VAEDDKPPQDPPAPPPPAGGPDEATVKAWIADAIAEALEGQEPPEPQQDKPTTAREREAIAEAAARKAVEAVKAADSKPPEKKDDTPAIEPTKKGPFQRFSEKMWGSWDEVAK
jgi:hypothetical protein